jgi:queuine tRNA-ribosyltransferase
LKSVNNQAMFSVIHGGIDPELRTKSINYLTSLPFDGHAIGGSLGNGRGELKELLTWMMPVFDEGEHRRSKPRHLLGIADEESIRNAVTFGIDTLDSCYPTRIARHGNLLIRNPDDPSLPGSSLKIRNQANARAFGVKVDDRCQCSTCQHYDRAYLWHLQKANEPGFTALAAQHNIHYMNDLMQGLRQDILEDRI